MDSQVRVADYKDYNQNMAHSVLPVAVVIPHWNQKELLDDCLQSLRASTYSNLKVIVVDNASTDESVAYLRQNYPWVNVIERPVNGGYAAALNRGIEAIRDESPSYYFLLNNDTVIPPDTISRLVNVMESDDGIAISAPLVLYESDPDKTFSLGDRCYRYLPLPVTFGAKKIDNPKNHRVMEFDYVFGCALLIRASIINEVGMFDPSYFMFFEDADYCRRVRDHGYKVVRDGSTPIFHKGSHSIRKMPSKMVWYRARNRIIFYRKYRHGPSQILTHVALGLGSMRRLLNYLLAGKFNLISAHISGAIEGYKIKMSDLGNSGKPINNRSNNLTKGDLHNLNG